MKNRGILFSIKEYGVGISKEDQKRYFRGFIKVINREIQMVIG